MGRFKIKGLRWYIAGLLCLVTTINYIDRTSLGVAGPALRNDLKLDENDFANIIVCFQLSYLIMQPIAEIIIGKKLDLSVKRFGKFATGLFFDGLGLTPDDIPAGRKTVTT